MPHNHSPRCCCEPTYNGAIVTSAKPCPSCIEHGELAMLGDNTNRSAQNPAINVPPVTTHSEFIGQMVTAVAAAQPAECPSCHAVGDQPHTDYCQLPLTDALRLANAQTSQPAATTSHPPTHTRSDHFTQLEHSVTWGNRTTTHLRALCHPHLCGQQPTPSQ